MSGVDSAAGAGVRSCGVESSPSDASCGAWSRALLTDLLQGGFRVRLKVGGHSMTPFIRRDDVVTIAPRAGARLSVGEVVAFTPSGCALIVHRIVGRTDEGLVPRGDAAPDPDPAVSHAEVVGIVTQVERGGRRVRVGLGPERRVVAWLSRLGLLSLAARLSVCLRGQSRSDSMTNGR